MVDYGIATIAARNATLTVQTTETEVITCLDENMLRKSQLSIFYKLTLGSATQVKFNYYFLSKPFNANVPPVAADWSLAPVKDNLTGILGFAPSVLDSTSPIVSAKIATYEDVPVPACYGLRITATAVNATATLDELVVNVRNN